MEEMLYIYVYKDLPPITYQLGHPGNFKNQQLNNEVKFELSKIQPFITNSGSSLNVKDLPLISSVEVESDIVLKLLAPWGGREDNTWAYITTGGTEGNIAGVHFGLKKFFLDKQGFHSPYFLLAISLIFHIFKILYYSQRCRMDSTLIPNPIHIHFAPTYSIQIQSIMNP